MDLSTLIFYVIVLSLLGFLFLKIEKRTVEALLKAWIKLHCFIATFFNHYFFFLGFSGFHPEKTIALYIGEKSGFLGFLISSIVGRLP